MYRILILSLLSLAMAMKPPCGQQCRFYHCNVVDGLPGTGLGRYAIGAPNFARLGPVICETGVDDAVGFVLKTGEPIRESPTEGDTPLKKWRPTGLSKRYPKKFFFVKNLDVYKKSGLARKPSTGNQLNLLHDQCIRLPLLQYQLLDTETKEVERIIKLKRSDKGACVAFRPRASNILIEFDWIGRDDLDLRVTEPDGDTLDRSNISSESGKFFQDNGSDSCFKSNILTGREGVIYRIDKPIPQAGEYTVEAFHFKNCGNGPTKWRFRVIVDGQLKVSEEGSSNKNNGDLIFSRTFLYEV